MNRIATAIREADPALGRELPGPDEHRLAELRSAGREPSVAPRPPRPRTRLVTTAAVAVAVTAATVLTLTVLRPEAAPADGIERAQRVVFDESVPAGTEAVVADWLSGERHDDASARQYLLGLRSSPQLRYGDPTGAVGLQGATADTGGASLTWGMDTYESFPDPAKGGNGTGADAVEIVVVQCAGEGEYSWTATGRSVALPTLRTVASATGQCGPGMSAARFVVPSSIVVTRLQVRGPQGRRIGLGAVMHYDLSAPHLDSPFFTG